MKLGGSFPEQRASRLKEIAALVEHTFSGDQLIEAKDERRLIRFQRAVSSFELLIVDELGFVPLSKTGAELLFEVFSRATNPARRW